MYDAKRTRTEEKKERKNKKQRNYNKMNHENNKQGLHLLTVPEASSSSCISSIEDTNSSLHKWTRVGRYRCIE